MNRTLILLAFAGLTLTACKPTYRKVPHKDKPTTEQTTPATIEEKAPEAAPANQEEAGPPSDCLMEVRSVTQGYNPLRPWEKGSSEKHVKSAIYLGDGKVLVSGEALENVTYVELGLPDGSRSVPARVVKHSTSLGLGLLTVAHDEDADIFETRRSYPIGSPLYPGEDARLWCVLRGTLPTSVALLAESGEDDGDKPLISVKAAQPVPDDLYSSGAPVIKDGKLVAMTDGYNQESLTLSCINAEILQRFLDEKAGENVPVLGIVMEDLNDPVFRRYLKVPTNKNGLYISKVLPGGAAESAGIRKGDVLTSIEGEPLDRQGRWPHPIYGPTEAGVILRNLKPLGGQITLGISREGEDIQVNVPLNREAVEKKLIGSEKPGMQPRYIVWGGLLFQPVTEEFIDALRSQARSLPVQFLELEPREKELRDKGVAELVALTQIIPTPATLGYESVAYCIVEKVNGKEIHDFTEFEEALDEPTADGLLHLRINRAPYEIHMDRQTAEACNDALHRNVIHKLRHTNCGEVEK